MPTGEAFIEPFQKVRIGVHVCGSTYGGSLKQKHRATSTRVDANFVFAGTRSDPQSGLADGNIRAVSGDPCAYVPTVCRVETVGRGCYDAGHCNVFVAVGIGNGLHAYYNERSCRNRSADRRAGD